MEPGVQTPEVTLTNGSGSCRDTGWLLVQALRHLGLAARFVSGYLIQLKPDVKALDGPSGTEVDFTDLHAWCEVYLPGAGWIGLDPTSGLLAGEGHIPVACTPEPSAQRGAGQRRGRRVRGRVRAPHAGHAHLRSAARHLPYTDAQWQAILALGHEVDQQLRGRRRAPDDGRRAHLRGGRRPRRRRVEHRRAGPHQARPGHRAGAPAARASTARAASCTSARASGTRASSCRAGR
jgi:hypothetical protein